MKLTNAKRRVIAVSTASLVLGVMSAGIGMGAASAGSSAPGVTSSSVTIGATVPLSGPASTYAEVSATAAAVFNYVNHTHSGINGRTINYIRLDDCYGLSFLGVCPNSTLQQTTTLVDTDHVFATVGSLGTLAQTSVLNFMKSNNEPQLFVNSGASQWNQPTKYPDLFGFQASYQTEGQIFAQYILAHDKGKTVGFIGQDDGIGKSGFGEEGFAGLTTDTGVSVSSGNTHYYQWTDAGNASELKTYVGDLKAANVKVVVLDSIPPVTEGIIADAVNDSYSPTWIISSVGSDPIAVNHSSENGATSFDGLPATNDSTNVWNVWVHKVLLESYNHSLFPSETSSTPVDANEQYGASYAVAFLEALQSLGKTGVTQAGILKAMTTTKFATPAVVPFSYSSKNHQGLTCGLLSVIESAGVGHQFVTEPSHAVSCTPGTPKAKITKGTYKVQAIPTYIK